MLNAPRQNKKSFFSLHWIFIYSWSLCTTGLPTKDETSVTIVRDLYTVLFLYDTLQLLTYFFPSKSFDKPLYTWDRILRLGSPNFKNFRSSLQSHPLWVTLSLNVFVTMYLNKIIMNIVRNFLLKNQTRAFLSFWTTYFNFLSEIFHLIIVD